MPACIYSIIPSSAAGCRIQPSGVACATAFIFSVRTGRFYSWVPVFFIWIIYVEQRSTEISLQLPHYNRLIISVAKNVYDVRYLPYSLILKDDLMPLSRSLRIAATLVTGLAVTLCGAALTWYQVSQAELNDTALAATQAVRANERLLDEAQSAAELVHPLLLQPCNPFTRTELSRLAIGIEHIRVINLFYHNHLTCSSWDGARGVKENVPAGPDHTVTLLTDDYISPGVPVIVLRSAFPEGTVTTSMTTHWSAVALKLLSTHRPLSLRADNIVLTADNRLRRAADADPGRGSRHAIHSGLYPFSVEYPGARMIPSTLYLREGMVSLVLSVLLGAAAAIGLWQLAFRQRTPYEQLTAALKRGEIVPWYQPVVDTQTGKITGVEVLARQIKSDGTVVPPDRFIPVAESSDLIIPLTRNLMALAARELSELLMNTDHHWHVGLNVTQAHVLEPGFPAECMTFMDAFAPGCIMLTVELTEREPFDSSPEMLRRLQQLHHSGIAVALDDFGTGYANLEYISEVHVDIIKIDRAFVRRIGQGETGERLLESLISMAGALELRMVAEGVETGEQAQWLSTHGVSWLQGYLFSPAVPVSQLSEVAVNCVQNFKKITESA